MKLLTTVCRWRRHVHGWFGKSSIIVIWNCFDRVLPSRFSRFNWTTTVKLRIVYPNMQTSVNINRSNLFFQRTLQPPEREVKETLLACKQTIDPALVMKITDFQIDSVDVCLLDRFKFRGGKTRIILPSTQQQSCNTGTADNASVVGKFIIRAGRGTFDNRIPLPLFTIARLRLSW